MSPEESDPAKNRSARRHEHREDAPARPAPVKGRSPRPNWSNKTMHHPATRIGEIKHGK
jgi:hypothetical protein